jgi:hypothetical protein
MTTSVQLPSGEVVQEQTAAASIQAPVGEVYQQASTATGSGTDTLFFFATAG